MKRVCTNLFFILLSNLVCLAPVFSESDSSSDTNTDSTLNKTDSEYEEFVNSFRFYKNTAYEYGIHDIEDLKNPQIQGSEQTIKQLLQDIQKTKDTFILTYLVFDKQKQLKAIIPTIRSVREIDIFDPTMFDQSNSNQDSQSQVTYSADPSVLSYFRLSDKSIDLSEQMSISNLVKRFDLQRRLTRKFPLEYTDDPSYDVVANYISTADLIDIMFYPWTSTLSSISSVLDNIDMSDFLSKLNRPKWSYSSRSITVFDFIPFITNFSFTSNSNYESNYHTCKDPIVQLYTDLISENYQIDFKQGTELPGPIQNIIGDLIVKDIISRFNLLDRSSFNDNSRHALIELLYSLLKNLYHYPQETLQGFLGSIYSNLIENPIFIDTLVDSDKSALNPIGIGMQKSEIIRFLTQYSYKVQQLIWIDNILDGYASSVSTLSDVQIFDISNLLLSLIGNKLGYMDSYIQSLNKILKIAKDNGKPFLVKQIEEFLDLHKQGCLNMFSE